MDQQPNVKTMKYLKRQREGMKLTKMFIHVYTTNESTFTNKLLLIPCHLIQPPCEEPLSLVRQLMTRFEMDVDKSAKFLSHVSLCLNFLLTFVAAISHFQDGRHVITSHRCSCRVLCIFRQAHSNQYSHSHTTLLLEYS